MKTKKKSIKNKQGRDEECLQFCAGNLADCSSHWQHHQLALHTFFDDDDDDGDEMMK